MSFGNFQSAAEVAKLFDVTVQVEAFLRPLPTAVDAPLAQRLDFSLRNMTIASEAARREFLIAPVLWEVWRPYSDVLLLWGHEPLGTLEPLRGIPDYFMTRRSKRGLVPEQPYIVVIEAKRDDFEWGWGQCLAGMLAAQRLNDRPTRTIFGCVTTGRAWQFGRLLENVFTEDIRYFTLSDLGSLVAAWNGLLALAKEQALAPAA